jgi:hypothetical protein
MTAPPTAAAQHGFCDAIGVIRGNCQNCHGASRMYGAPMSMVTYDDLQKPAVTDATKKVYQLVALRIHDANKPMPPSGFSRLADPDLATLDGWIGGGALPGADPTCGGAATANPPAGTGAPVVNAPPTQQPDFVWPEDCETHYTLLISNGAPGTKQSVQPGQEVHTSVNFTPPWTGAVQSIAFKPITDNAKIIHHWILYSADGAFLTGWAPGSDGTRIPLPSDVGMYLPPSGQMRMDIHYNNLGGTTVEQDASGVEMCVISTASKFRKNTATVVGISGNANAPAHQRVDNATTCTVTASMGSATLIYNSPHMHMLGVHAKFELIQGGKTTVLHDAPFSFDDQHNWVLDPRVTVMSGDKFTVTCSYQNDTNKAVTFGENTGNEMCFNFVTVYPKGGFSCR